MGFVIVVANEKGGSGKSTVAVNLATMLAQDYERVFLLDTDQQMSSASFIARRDELGVTPTIFSGQEMSKSLPKMLVEHKKHYDVVVVDLAGRSDSFLQWGLSYGTDYVILPVMAGTFDLWASGETFERCARFLEDPNPKFAHRRVMLVMNGIMPNTIIAKEFQQFCEEVVSEYRFILAKTRLCARKAYTYTVSLGLGVHEATGEFRNKQAIDEFTALYQEILEMIHDSQEK